MLNKKTMKKIISIKENNTTTGIITELVFNKKAKLYKTAKEFEIYQLKNSDIKIALISNDAKHFTGQKKGIEYNTQVIKNLYNANTLSIDMIITLFDNYVFM